MGKDKTSEFLEYVKAGQQEEALKLLLNNTDLRRYENNSLNINNMESMFSSAGFCFMLTPIYSFKSN